MSGINTIRRITETDTTRLEAAALRFAARHGLGDISPDHTGMDSASSYLDCHLHGGDKRLARLWQAAFCRALGFKPCADLAVGWGYVGTRCK